MTETNRPQTAQNAVWMHGQIWRYMCPSKTWKPFKQTPNSIPLINSLRLQTAGGWQRGGVITTYPANLHQLSDHDDAEAVFLPHHPPEIIQSLLLGSCWEEQRRFRDGKMLRLSLITEKTLLTDLQSGLITTQVFKFCVFYRWYFRKVTDSCRGDTPCSLYTLSLSCCPEKQKQMEKF